MKRPRYQIDLSPDLAHQTIRHRVDVSYLEHLLFTHADADHCSPEYLDFRRTIRSAIGDLPQLHLYGSGTVEARIAEKMPNMRANRCSFHVVEDGRVFTAGDVTVTPFTAVHGAKQGCFHYGIDDGKHRVLFAWDGTWSQAVWQRLRTYSFDAMVIECTHLGPSDKPMSGHLTADGLIDIRQRLVAQGTLREDSAVVAIHIGDNGGLLHSEAEALMSKHSIVVGYDGFCFQVT